MLIDNQSDANWEPIWCQLKTNIMPIDSRYDTNGSQLDTQKLKNSKYMFKLFCQWIGITVNWQIGVGLVDFRFSWHWESGQNRGFLLVESSEYWLLIGRKVIRIFFEAVTLKILKLCQSRIFDINWQSIGWNYIEGNFELALSHYMNKHPFKSFEWLNW